MFTEIDDQTFAAGVAEGLSLVLFFKDRCPYCRAMEKILTKFSGMPAAQGKNIRYFTINRETSPEAAAKWGVERTPTVFVFRDGQMSGMKSGDVTYRELERMVA